MAGRLALRKSLPFEWREVARIWSVLVPAHFGGKKQGDTDSREHLLRVGNEWRRCADSEGLRKDDEVFPGPVWRLEGSGPGCRTSWRLLLGATLAIELEIVYLKST